MTVLLCALQWNLSIVDTPGTAENVLISEVSLSLGIILYTTLSSLEPPE